MVFCYGTVTETQVPLPGATKPKLMRQVFLVRRKVVYSSSGHLARWGTHPKAHVPISVQIEVFIKKERDNKENKGRGSRVLC